MSRTSSTITGAAEGSDTGSNSLQHFSAAVIANTQHIRDITQGDEREEERKR